MKGRTQEIQLPVLGEVQGPTEHMKATAKKGKRQSELHKFRTHLFHRQKPEVQDDASDRIIGKEKYCGRRNWTSKLEKKCFSQKPRFGSMSFCVRLMIEKKTREWLALAPRGSTRLFHLSMCPAAMFLTPPPPSPPLSPNPGIIDVVGYSGVLMPASYVRSTGLR